MLSEVRESLRPAEKRSENLATAIALELQDTKDLSKTFLVYQGGSSFDELVGLARAGGWIL